MKYDDANWHSGGQFPQDSPPEYGGTHIALLLKWCFLKGWVGELQVKESAPYLDKLLSGEMSATEFLFKNCDGKFTDEDLSNEGNAFLGYYYGKNGPYLDDYAAEFGNLMYVAGEEKHDFERFAKMVDRRLKAHTGSKKQW
jgi:hypothetical protein